MRCLVIIGIVIIYYVLIGAVVVITDLLRYNDEYMDNLIEMINNLDRDMRNALDNSDFVAVEICARMLLNEVLIWPIVFVARVLDIYIGGDDKK